MACVKTIAYKIGIDCNQLAAFIGAVCGIACYCGPLHQQSTGIQAISSQQHLKLQLRNALRRTSNCGCASPATCLSKSTIRVVSSDSSRP